jgi:ubiquinone/menaquinone biosynthesis C-methylase UbiE
MVKDNTIEQVAQHWEQVRFSDGLYDYERTWWGSLCSIAAKSERILEIGAGSGRILNLLAEETESNLWAVDITSQITTLTGQASCAWGDTRSLPLADNKFDLVYSLGVIEHFPETSQAIIEHARVTKQGGYVLVTTPRLGIFTLKRLLSFYVVKRRCRFGSFEVIQGRNLRLDAVQDMFKAAKLRVLESGASGIYTPWGYRRLPIRWLDNLIGGYLYCIGVKEG